MNNKRVNKLNNKNYTGGGIVYWMSRDQRIEDNWALIYAQNEAIKHNVSLIIVFCLVPVFLDATIRHYGFMLKGLQEIEDYSDKLNIDFKILTGKPEEEIINFISEIKAGMLVCDFDPLLIKQRWKKAINIKLDIPFYEVDAHNIIPYNIVSQKQEYAAYTIRPKIKRLLPEFLEPFPQIIKNNVKLENKNLSNNWQQIYDSLQINMEVKEVDWLIPGSKAAHAVLKDFIDHKLPLYNENRNDPTKDALSNLSPYMHFGHISPQRVAMEISDAPYNSDIKESYLEELIVRRELSDNYCFYNPDYDSLNSVANWAKETLNLHKKDLRVYLYSLEQLEKSQTHDDLWNASQIEMVTTGKMHSYMRMYWAKKILEWTNFPEEAIKYAIYLNDKYQLDGRDPNGYTGIMWSIAGIHDRAWKERDIFGKIRYMSYSGCKRKFDIASYINKYS